MFSAKLKNHIELIYTINAIQDEHLCPTQHHIFLVVCLFTDDNFEFDTSYAQIAQIVRKKESLVRNKMKDLVKKGYLELVQKFNIYTLEPNIFRISTDKITSKADKLIYIRTRFKP